MGRDFLYPTAFIWRFSLKSNAARKLALPLLPAVLPAELQAFAKVTYRFL
jgi:hypothetical protein